MKYATFGQDGKLNGRYDSEIHTPAQIPVGAVEIPDDLFFRTINESDGQWELSGGVVVKSAFPALTTPPIAEVRKHMQASRFQARAAMLNAGLLAAVDAYFSDPARTPMEKLAWSEAVNFYRLSPLVVSAGAALGLTDSQLDNLFTAAANIAV